MLKRLEAEQQIKIANILFATEGQAMSDLDRSMFLGDLHTSAQGHVTEATYDSLAEAGIEVVVEQPPEGVLLPPGVEV